MKSEIKYSFNALLALSVMTFLGCGSESVKQKVDASIQSKVKNATLVVNSTQEGAKVLRPANDDEGGMVVVVIPEEEIGDGGTTQPKNQCPSSTECGCDATQDCLPHDCSCDSNCDCNCDCPTECNPILPQTGQTASYHKGDDGNLTKGVARAFDRNNTTNIVTDLATGLAWEDTLNDDDRTWVEAKTYCAGVGVGWRLPLQEELIHLINRGSKNPAIYYPPFQNTFSDYYWSSEKNALNPSKIWGVSFDDGDQWLVDATDDWAKIRCVKGESITHDFQRDDDKEVVVDKKACLMWQDDSNVSDDENGFKSWEGALDYCNNLDHAGYNSGWRLPNYTELISIVDRSRNVAPVTNTEFKHTSDWAAYWTSTTYFDPEETDIAWFIEFKDGTDGVEKKSKDWFLVRCVRDANQNVSSCEEQTSCCNGCTDDNVAPTVNMINRGYIPNSDLEIILLASDVNGDDLTFTIVEEPKHGTVTLIMVGSKNIAVYTPEKDYSGDDNFTYKVNDGCLDSNIGKVTLFASIPI
jgi:hypothetical protein